MPNLPDDFFIQKVILLGTGVPGTVALRDDLTHLYQQSDLTQFEARIDDFVKQLVAEKGSINGAIQTLIQQGFGIDLTAQKIDQLIADSLRQGINSEHEYFTYLINELDSSVDKILDNRAVAADAFTDLLKKRNIEINVNDPLVQVWIDQVDATGPSLAIAEATLEDLINRLITPVLAGSDPLDDAIGVPVNANIVLTFSEAVKAGVGEIVIEGDDEHEIRLNVADTTQVIFDGGSIVTLNPIEELHANVNYNVQIASGVITDLVGNPFAGSNDPTALNFNTNDISAPTLVSSDPLDDAIGVPVNANIVLTFSEAVKAGVGEIVIEGDDEHEIRLNVADTTQVIFDGGSIVTLNPIEELHANVNYNVQIASGVITDLVGNPFAGSNDPTALNFNTNDISAPTLVSSDPLDDAIGVPVNANIVLTFSEAVKAGVGEIVIEGDDEHEIRLNVADTTQVIFDGGSIVTLNPIEELHANVNYNVQIASGVITDLVGNPFAGSNDPTALNFNTNDISAPTLVSSDPLDDAIGVPVNANIVLTFSEAVKAGVGEIVIEGDDEHEIRLNVADTTQVIFDGGSIVTLNPIEELHANVNYNVQIASGVITDLVGNPFAGSNDPTALNFNTNDISAPTLVSSDPLDDAIGVPVNANIVLTFSEAVKAGVGEIVIEGDDEHEIRLNVADTTQVIFDGGSIVTLNPIEELHANVNYNVQIASGVITDLVGNPFAGSNDPTALNFNTNDISAPTLVSSDPLDDAIGVPVNANIVLTFSEAVKAGVGEIVIEGDDEHEIRLNVADTTQVIFDGGSIVTLNPNEDLHANVNYNVQIASGVITDLVGNPFAGSDDPTALNFNTNDISAPTLVSSDPLDDAIGVPVNADIGLTFSEVVKAGVGEIVIEGDDEHEIRLNVADTTQVIFDGGSIVTLNPIEELHANVNYNVQIASGVITDLVGNPFAGSNDPTALNFNTNDISAPTLVSSDPLDDAIGVPVNANIVLTFSEAVKAGVGEIVIEGDDEHEIRLNVADTTQVIFDGGSIVTLNPNEDLHANVNYNVQIASGVITDLVGNPFAGSDDPTALNFNTNDISAPTLVSSDPLDDAIGVPVNADIGLTFSEVVKAGVGEIVIEGDDEHEIRLNVADYTQVIFEDIGIVTLNPNEELHANVNYNVQIASGVITDLAGIPFDGTSDPEALNFQTGPDTIPPEFVSSTPADNATEVSIDTNIVLTFSEAVKAGSGNIVISDNNGDTRSIPVTDDQVRFDGNTVTINPVEELHANVNYNVQIASGVITDLAGIPFEGTSDPEALNFNTQVDIPTPPTLSSTIPADNATGVAVGDDIVLTFNETVKAGTGNIIISSDDGEDVRTFTVPDTTGQVTFNDKTVTLNPAEDLNPEVIYQVKVESGAIVDLAGIPYGGSSDLNFDTIPPASTFTLIHGADNLTGTTGNDTFTAGFFDNDGRFVNTLESIDTLDGGGGADTLNAALVEATTTTPSITSIETINFRNLGSDATINFSNTVGAGQIWNDASSESTILTYEAAPIAAIFGVRDTTSTTDINISDDLTSTTDNLALAAGDAEFDIVDAVITSSTDAAAIETMSIAANGENFVDVSAFNAITALTVTGSGSLNVDVAVNVLQTVDASTNTGGVTVDLSAATNDLTVTGGSGNDALIGGSGNDALVGGDGNDTIFFGAGASGLELGAIDIVADFTSGTDHLDFGGPAGTNTNFFNLGGFALQDYNLALIEANIAMGFGVRYIFVDNPNGGWVFVNNDADVNADLSIELTGVTSIVAADIAGV